MSAIKDREFDFEAYQGDAYRKVLRFYAGDVPRNLAGIAGRMQVRESYGGAVLFDLTTSGGGLEFTDGTGENGELAIVLTPEQAASVDIDLTPRPGTPVPRKVCVYDLEIVPPGGGKKTELWGKFTFQAEATK